MLKSYIMFGKKEDLLMFIEGYTAVVRYLKRGPWYIEANMESGNVSHVPTGNTFWRAKGGPWGPS